MAVVNKKYLKSHTPMNSNNMYHDMFQIIFSYSTMMAAIELHRKQENAVESAYGARMLHTCSSCF
jgi:hypothetical protein